MGNSPTTRYYVCAPKSQLIEDGRCDPNVKWEENGVTMTLKKVLLRQRAEEEGNEVYKIHRASMRRLKAAVAQPERNNDVPMEADYKAELDIMGIGLVVASGAAAAGAAAAAGVATMGGVLPLSAVGSALWEVRWATDSNQEIDVMIPSVKKVKAITCTENVARSELLNKVMSNKIAPRLPSIHAGIRITSKRVCPSA